jgi:carbon starvation protein
MARSEISGLSGLAATLEIFFVVVIATAGLGVTMINALTGSSWATFTIATTFPIAMIMGLWMYKIRPGKGIREATIFGIVALVAAVIGGKLIPESSFASWFTYSPHGLTILLAFYALAASVLPVWLLLAPRGYLSTFMKLGTIGALIIGVLLVHPNFRMPALTQFDAGGGPIIPGPMWPFCFITIACGAISGFHSLISSGTTPKMVSQESHMRPVGYGAMLCEGVVGIMALVAATSMYPGDYFAINANGGRQGAVFQQKVASIKDANGAPLYPVTNLDDLSAQVGENVDGRTGGAVSLAVGMAQIFSAIPGMRSLMSYWYHFAIMFEAVFILTTIESGTRVGSFITQEFVGKKIKFLGNSKSIPANILSSSVVVFAWAYFLWSGNISTIWPMFGIANQLLAAIALTVGTSMILNMGKTKYAWVTFVPMLFLSGNTLWGGFLSIRDNFWPLTLSPTAALQTQGWVDTLCTATMMFLVFIILFDAFYRWYKVLFIGVPQVEYAGD